MLRVDVAEEVDIWNLELYLDFNTHPEMLSSKLDYIWKPSAIKFLTFFLLVVQVNMAHFKISPHLVMLVFHK